MSAFDAVYAIGSLLAVMVICSLPVIGSLHGAGPRYRAALLRQLGIGWGIAAAAVGWLALGWSAVEAGGRWFHTYRDLTLVLMGAFVPLLFAGIRHANRTAAAAQTADRGELA